MVPPLAAKPLIGFALRAGNSYSDQKLDMALRAIGAAYGSHLVLDATTPMGLPLCCAR